LAGPRWAFLAARNGARRFRRFCVLSVKLHRGYAEVRYPVDEWRRLRRRLRGQTTVDGETTHCFLTVARLCTHALALYRHRSPPRSGAETARTRNDNVHIRQRDRCNGPRIGPHYDLPGTFPAPPQGPLARPSALLLHLPSPPSSSGPLFFLQPDIL